MTTCSVDDCEKSVGRNGMCWMHIKRLQVRGTTDPWRRHTNPLERVDKSGPGGCWIWLGRTDEKGYGRLKSGGRHWSAHRYFWTHLRGPILDGLEIDHLCKVTSCVNPEHLEPVTRRENLARSDGTAARAMRENTCFYGHPFTPENTWRSPSRPNKRRCRQCRRDRHQRIKETRQPRE